MRTKLTKPRYIDENLLDHIRRLNKTRAYSVLILHASLLNSYKNKALGTEIIAEVNSSTIANSIQNNKTVVLDKNLHAVHVAVVSKRKTLGEL